MVAVPPHQGGTEAHPDTMTMESETRGLGGYRTLVSIS